MKLQQLLYIWEIAQHELNVSATANHLRTSQPGISKQLGMLEDELGTQIFARNGKHLSKVTPAGKEIVALAGEILGKVQCIKNIAQEFKDNRFGILSVGTTHNQARYALPVTIREFMQRYPGVKLDLHQGTPMQVAEQASRGVVDIAITTEALEEFENLILLPCHEWHNCVLVPNDHPLVGVTPLTLEAIAEFPIVTYLSGFTGRAKLDHAFALRHLHPTVALTAADADVIKTYVKIGLGVGIVAQMAYDPIADRDLTALDAGHLFEPSVTKIGLRKDMFIRGYLYDFIQIFAPHLTRDVVDAAQGIEP